MTTIFLSIVIAFLQIVFGPRQDGPHATASLVSDVETVEAGGTVTVGLHLEIEDGWHIYWLNPGDSGMPTRIEWNLPDGFEAGDLQWPYPIQVAEGPYVTYAYKQETTLLTDVTLPASLETGSTVELQGHASWLVCKDICLPEEADVSITLEIGQIARPSTEWSEHIDSVRGRLPVPSDNWDVTASPHGNGYMVRLSPRDPNLVAPDSVTFFAIGESVIDHAAPQLVSRDGNDLVISLAPSP